MDEKKREQDSNLTPRFCVYCGKELGDSPRECPHCGKSIDFKSEEEKGGKTRWKAKVSQKRSTQIRECPQCGTQVKSKVLIQCPMCMGVLPPLEKNPEEEETYLFQDGKLKREKDMKLFADRWKFKESMNIFINSIIAFMITLFITATIFLFQFQDPEAELGITVTSVILDQIPSIIFGLVPIFYLVARNHKFSKLGLKEKDWLLDIFLGVMVGIGCVFVYNAGAWLNAVLVNVGAIWLAPASVDVSNLVDTAAWEKLIVGLVVIFASIGEEIVFRGVLARGLEAKFMYLDENAKNKQLRDTRQITHIIIVCIINAAVVAWFMALFTLSLSGLIANILVNFVICLIFIIRKDSLYLTIIAQVLFALLSFLDLIAVIAI